MKREEPIQPPSGVQDWHIEGKKAVHAICPFSHRQNFPKDFPTLKSKDGLKHQNVLWKHLYYRMAWRRLSDPWQIAWTLDFPSPIWRSGSCIAACSWVRHLMVLQQRRGLKVSRPNRPVWTECELGVSVQPQSQAVGVMLLRDFWNRLRRRKSQEQPLQESKTRLSLLRKTLKIVISFWMKCRGWGFS